MDDLPPLPYPQMPGNDYTGDDMRKYAIAAIERHKARTPDALREAARMALLLMEQYAARDDIQHIAGIVDVPNALRAALEGDQ